VRARARSLLLALTHSLDTWLRLLRFVMENSQKSAL